MKGDVYMLYKIFDMRYDNFVNDVKGMVVSNFFLSHELTQI
jgi:hypothetical protein